MSIEISTVDATESADWNRYVERAPAATPFHYYEALELLAEETNTTLHTLVGRKGNEPVGLLPVFERTVGPFTLVVSPPELSIYTLGPVVLHNPQLKQRKRERRHRRFVKGALEWIDRTLDPEYTDIRTVAQYEDVRPFIWEAFDVSPSYTYHVDLTPTTDDLLARFSRDARKTIRDFDPSAGGITFQTGDTAAIPEIVDQLSERHEAQGESFALSVSFVERLADRLPDDALTVYSVRAGGTPIGGMITLAHGDTIYRWQGGAKTDGPLSSNAILDWEIIKDGKSRGYDRYDLVGANLPRLCRYKAKFNPTPEEYYVATRRSSTFAAASRLKRLLPVG